MPLQIVRNDITTTKMDATIGRKLFADIAAYIDDRYVDAHTDSRETSVAG